MGFHSLTAISTPKASLKSWGGIFLSLMLDVSTPKASAFGAARRLGGWLPVFVG